MTILCDEQGTLQIQHWPPLPIDDTVAISQILEVRIRDNGKKIDILFRRNRHLLWKKY